MCFRIILFGLLLLCGANSSAEQKSDGRFVLRDLDPDTINYFMQAVFDQKGQLVPEDQPKYDKNLIESWVGNKPQLAAVVPEYELVLRNTDGSQQFVIDVAVNSDGVVVKSDRPGSWEFSGGLKIAHSEDKTWRFYFSGVDQTGFAVVVPPRYKPRASKMVIPVLICPRDVQTRPGEKVKGSIQSEFQVVAVRPKVTGYATGKVISLVDPALAIARVLTIPNVPLSVAYEDRVNARDPKAYVKYEPTHAVEAETTDLKGGVMAEVFLQNRAGYQRRTLVRDVVWVVKVDTDKSFIAKWPGGGDFEISPGACFLAVNDKSSWHEYDRATPVVAP